MDEEKTVTLTAGEIWNLLCDVNGCSCNDCPLNVCTVDKTKQLHTNALLKLRKAVGLEGEEG